MLNKQNKLRITQLVVTVMLSCLFVSAFAGIENDDKYSEFIKSMSDQSKVVDYDLIIDTDTTWNGTMNIGRVLITNGATLTIEAGTQVIVSTGESDGIIKAEHGNIICQGEEGNYVIFSSTDEPYDGSFGRKWIGIFLSPVSNLSTASVNYTLILDAFTGVWGNGSNAYFSVTNSLLFNCTIGVFSPHPSHCHIADCVAGNTLIGFYISDGQVLRCKTDHSDTGIQATGYGNISIQDCEVSNCRTGYSISGKGTVNGNNAHNCETGFWTEMGSSYDQISMRDNEAIDCDRGAYIHGRVSVNGLVCTGSSIYGLSAYPRNDMPISLYNLNISGTTDGPGLDIDTQGDYGALVTLSHSTIENNKININIQAWDHGQVTTNPIIIGQGNIGGQNNILSGPLTEWDIFNRCTGTTVSAEYCYWGQEGFNVPTPAIRGYADITPYLIGDINIHDGGFSTKSAPDADTIVGAYPNPFNPSTNIAFNLPNDGGHVRLDIYDIRGHLVTNLADEMMTGQRAEVKWNGTNSRGNVVAAGTYFYMLQVDGKREANGKLVMAK